ncbi:MAG: hypothetical protein PHW04_10705 [Candidatus Wallbacteria bacterium]|nr:hypothetical protein [Candidatus Wallbacteria bacterium]
MTKKGITAGEIITALFIAGVLGILLGIGYLKKSSERNSSLCMINMKAIKTVIEYYNSETMKTEKVSFPNGLGQFQQKHEQALQTYFQGNRFPNCPSDGNYGINDYGELYCSKHTKNTIPIEGNMVQNTAEVTAIQPVKPDNSLALSEDEQFFQKAKKFLQEKNFSQAGYFYQRAYELSPEKDYYLYYASDAYFKAEEFGKARIALGPILKNKKAQDLAKIIQKYEYFKTRLSAYEAQYSLFQVLKTYGNDEAILRTNLLGRNEQIIRGNLYLADFYLALKENAIYFINSDNIFHYDLASGKNDVLYNNSGLVMFSITAKGNKVAFISPKINNISQLILLDTSTRIAQSVTTERNDVKKAIFSANGYYIYYLSGNKIYKYNLETQQSSISWENPTFSAYDFALHPKKEQLAIVVSTGDYPDNRDLILVDLDNPQKHTQLTTSQDAREVTPSFSPQGNFLTYVTRLNKVENLYAYDMNNKSSIALTQNDLEGKTFFPTFCWFPDEQFFYYSYGDESSHSLYLMEFSSHQNLRLLEKGSDIANIQLFFPQKKESTTQDLKLFH